MAVDIFEHLVRAYFQSKGYFTIENVSYAPHPDAKVRAPFDTDPSDIDIVAVAPRKQRERVLVISCKATPEGFDAADVIRRIEKGQRWGNRDAWRHFRELVSDEWARALHHRVFHLTGERQLTHVTAVSRLIGAATPWTSYSSFIKRLNGIAPRLVTADHMLRDLLRKPTAFHPASDARQLLNVVEASVA